MQIGCVAYYVMEHYWIQEEIY